MKKKGGWRKPYIKIESIANKNSYPEKNYNNAATEKTSYSMLAIM